MHLAEYFALCSEYFDFVFAIGFYFFGAVFAVPPRRPEEARSADDGRSGGNGGPACLPANFQAIAKKNQNIRNKVSTTQPIPQYSAKNNVTIHVIVPFMPKQLIIMVLLL